MSDESDRMLAKYLAELDQVQPLTPEQEWAAAAAIALGRVAQIALDQPVPLPADQRVELEMQAAQGLAARRTLLEAHLALVVTLAHRYEGGPLDLLSLIQECNLGLMTALERFDPAKGYRFPTYATWWIRQAIAVALKQAG